MKRIKDETGEYYKSGHKLIDFGAIADEVYDELDDVLAKLDHPDLLENMYKLAEIYESNNSLAEKGALMSDLFNKIVDDEATKRWEKMGDD